MTIEEAYEQMGGDLQDFLGRVGTTRLATKLLLMFDKDPSYNELVDSFGRDEAVAFRAAHTLKGVALNLGLKKLGQSASALTEALRPGNAPVPFEEQQSMFLQIGLDYQMVMDTIEIFKATNAL